MIGAMTRLPADDGTNGDFVFISLMRDILSVW